MDSVESELRACSSSEGRRELLAAFLRKYEKRLHWLIHARMDRRLRPRLDSSDVLQNTYLEASRRIDEYVRSPDMPLFIWLRFLALQILKAEFRHHVKAKGRDPAREVPINLNLDSTWGGGVQPAAPDGTASQIFVKHQREKSLKEALGKLDPLDQEILALRDFERLTSGETAALLGVTQEAVRQRHLRALTKLRRILKRDVRESTHFFVS